MPNQQTIIFDLDGTLIHSAPGIIAAFGAVLNANQLTPLIPLNEGIIGPPLLETMARLTGETGNVRLTQLTDAFKAAYDVDGVRATNAYPEIDILLATLSTHRRRLFVATNKRIAPTRAIVDRLGWAPHFEGLYALDSYQPRLVDKGTLLRHLLGEQQLLGTDCIYVGDKHEDGIAADINGIPFIAAHWGYGEFALADSPPHWMHARSPASLLELLLA